MQLLIQRKLSLLSLVGFYDGHQWYSLFAQPQGVYNMPYHATNY